MGELKAFSRVVSFSSTCAGLSYVPEFLAKTETSSLIFDSVSAGFHGRCSRRAFVVPGPILREYLRRTSKFVNRPRRLFVSPRPSRSMSKNGISFLLREVIVQSGASSEEVATLRAHSTRGIATSSAFFKNWSISSVLESAS